MLKLFTYFILAILAVFAIPVLANDNTPQKPLEIGIIPYSSTRALISTYEPMRQYLETTLGRPVKIFTSNGFKQFFLNSQKGDYDLVISAAHFARILQKENAFKPLVRFSTGGRGLVMTTLNSPIKSVKDLKGQTVAIPDVLSLASIVCLTHLNEAGLKQGKDFQLLEVPSFASAILSLQKGDATAAVSAPGALVQMAKEMRESVRPVVDTGEYVNLIILSHSRMDNKLSGLIHNALLRFGNTTKEGKQFLSNTGFGNIIPVTAKDMNSLDRYTPETKRLLNVN
jgi:phosphonate transport system substrate-binding protein